MTPPGRVAVFFEVTLEQAVASALDWPGWCRAGRDEQAALAALARYAGRYAPVAKQAGAGFPVAAAFDVAERVPGGRPRSRRQNAAARSRKSPPQRSRRTWPRPGPALGRPGHRGLGGLRRNRRRVTGRGDDRQ